MAKDITNGQPYVIKTAKSHLNGRYLQLLRQEFEIMNEKLKDLDCIVKPIAMSRQLVNPQDYS